jgi:hypothetical protein
MLALLAELTTTAFMFEHTPCEKLANLPKQHSESHRQNITKNGMKALYFWIAFV